jgi:hypothetical protein
LNSRNQIKTMADEKPPKLDDAASAASPAGSLSEKTLEADEKTLAADDKNAGDEKQHLDVDEKALEAASTGEDARTPAEGGEAPLATGELKEEGLGKVVSAKDAIAELNRVMTSGEGIEYPTGARLNLVSLALCLSVFLMALDNTIIATAIPHITDQFHSLPGEFSLPELKGKGGCVLY